MNYCSALPFRFQILSLTSKFLKPIRYKTNRNGTLLNFKISTSATFLRPLKYKVPKITNSQTFQDAIFKYLCGSDNCENIIQKFDKNEDILRLHTIFSTFENSSGNSFKKLVIPQHLIPVLPTYIATMKQRRVSNKYVTMCDQYCAQSLEFGLRQNHNVPVLNFLHAWMIYLYPNFNRLHQLQCYGKLLQSSYREAFEKSHKDSSKYLVHLAFLAGIGKKNVFESHELLNQLANLCDSCSEKTYKNWNPFELSIICESFFKGGIKIVSEDFLSHVSNTICQLLSETIRTRSSSGFNPFVVSSLLKILRQVNYVEEKLLKLLAELIVRPENEDKVRNIRFLTNIVSAFVGPGQRNLNQGSESDLSVVKVMSRVEHLVVGIIRDEEDARSGITKEIARTGGGDDGTSTTTKEVDSSMKSRLKDISRWFWATASLGYPISPEAYHEGLSRRFSSREFNRRTADAVDALLALAIMNHYLEAIVMKVLHSPDFRSALRVKCSKRDKGRFGLFLTSLKIERNDLWRQLSSKDVAELIDIVGPSRSETEGWSSKRLRVKARHDKMASVSSIRDYTPHSELLNQCIDALNVIFNTSKGEDNNDLENENCSYKNTIDVSSSRVDYRWKKGFASAQNLPSQITSSLSDDTRFYQLQVFQGYAVPYLHIPGIKVILPNTGRELYIEVLDDEAISPGLHQFKLRLLSRMGCTVLSMTKEEVIKCPNLVAYLEVSIERTMRF